MQIVQLAPSTALQHMIALPSGALTQAAPPFTDIAHKQKA